MDGEAIVRALLVADLPVTALVPAERIVADMLPTGIQLPAIEIDRISAVDRNIPTPGTTRHVTERVQVTVAAANKPQKMEILRAVKAAVADFIGAAAGLTGVTIETDLAGPDITDEQASIRFGSQDFIVGYTEQR